MKENNLYYHKHTLSDKINESGKKKVYKIF